MGRHKKPTSQLKLEGRYQPSWHGDRGDEPVFDGVPVKPEGMLPEASKHWDEVVVGLIAAGVAKKGDQPALVEMCNWWADLQMLRQASDRDYRNMTLAAMCFKQWISIASRFGMTPSDRAKLSVEKKPEYHPLAEFVA